MTEGNPQDRHGAALYDHVKRLAQKGYAKYKPENVTGMLLEVDFDPETNISRFATVISAHTFLIEQVEIDSSGKIISASRLGSAPSEEEPSDIDDMEESYGEILSFSQPDLEKIEGSAPTIGSLMDRFKPNEDQLKQWSNLLEGIDPERDLAE